MKNKLLIHSSNKKNKNVRNLLLFFTILFFLFFIFLFIVSFQQYQIIQKRIQAIIEESRYAQNNYSEALALYNEVEDNFRQYSIKFDQNKFDTYTEKLKELEAFVDMLADREKRIDKSRNNSKELEELSIFFYQKLLALKQEINTCYAIASDIQSLPKQFAETKQKSLAETPTIKPSLLTHQKEEITVKKRPFLQRLFSKKKADTLLVQTAVPQHNEIKTIERQNRANIITLNNSFMELRERERILLANNFNHLFSISKIIHNINDKYVNSKKNSTEKEAQTLLLRSNQFKWKIFLCLVFMFIMLCIIIYYQFFTSYYEEKLIEEKQYAANLAEEKTEILAEITHEIRTPINSLIGIIDLLRKKRHLYNNTDQLLVDTAYSSMINTSKTIDDILNLNKIDLAQNELKKFDIEILARDILKTQENQAQMKQLKLSYVQDSDMPTIILSDEFKIKQILTNLISNAIRYSKEGYITCSVKIDDLSILTLIVQDEGIGISEEIRQNIFKKYFTANNESKSSEGIGLGLYITHKLITSLNGKISYKSMLNKGSEFTVEIPIPQAEFKKEKKSKDLTLNDLNKNLCWLIVDDNALNLLYLQQYFARFQKVMTATNGFEALELIKTNNFDVIITDINMPMMTGDQLLVEIRKEIQYNHIKVIATSSDNEQVKKLEIKHNTYFDGFLTKPFEEKKLTTIIIESLGLDLLDNTPV